MLKSVVTTHYMFFFFSRNITLLEYFRFYWLYEFSNQVTMAMIGVTIIHYYLGEP